MSSSDLYSSLSTFLEQHYCFKKPLILAFSGGEDSTALLFALLAVKKKHDFPLHLAHLDHGWREDSGSEALILKKLAEAYSIPFHTKRVQEGGKSSEELGRKERLAFFQEIAGAINAKAVLLGHHAKDQAETVLKRIFEGGAIWNKHGMQGVCVYEDLTLWRPWISIPKQEILKSLQANPDAKPFQDSTNSDSRYLRSRLRHQILPELSQQFGKEICSSLCRLGEETNELQAFLERKILAEVSFIEGPFGVMCQNLEPFLDEPFALSFIATTLARLKGWTLSYFERKEVVSLLQARLANKCVVGKEATLWMDRGRLFLEFKGAMREAEPLELRDGIKFGDWTVRVERDVIDLKSNDWSQAWKGAFSFILPVGTYTLSLPSSTLSYLGTTSLKKWWGGKKVPAFLWRKLPVICDEKQVVGEFLSGKQKKSHLDSEEKIKVTLTYEKH